MTRIARWFFVLYLCGVVYVSLYPWHFLSQPRSLELLRVPLYNRRLVLDAVLNVLFYVPMGAAAFVSLRRGWRAWIAATAAGTLISFAIETAQLYTPTRAGTLSDLETNALGAAVGASLGYVLTSPRLAARVGALFPGRRWFLSPTGAVFFILWTLWQTFPFIPYVGWYRIEQELRGLAGAPWSWLACAQAFMGFLVLVRVLGPVRWTWIAFALLPAHLFLADRTLSPPLVLGAAAGWIAARYLLPRGASRGLAVALVLWLAFEEFRPFHWAASPKPFTWSPVESWYETGFIAYYATAFRKLFLYTSVIWSLRGAGLRWPWAVGVPALLLAAGEWTQQYLAGRTPETADLFILAAGAGILVLVRHASGGHTA